MPLDSPVNEASRLRAFNERAGLDGKFSPCLVGGWLRLSGDRLSALMTSMGSEMADIHYSR